MKRCDCGCLDTGKETMEKEPVAPGKDERDRGEEAQPTPTRNQQG